MPMENVETAPTLRETLEESYDAVAAGNSSPAEAPAVEGIVVPTEPIGETPEQKQGRLAGRARDEHGRVLPGKAATEPVSATPAKAPVTPSGDPAQQALAEPQNGPKYPSTLRRGYEADWEKLDPKFKAELDRREESFAHGVSVYKAEAENAKHLNEAIAPFLPNLQRHGMEPTTWIRNLGSAHERLALGSPEEKVQMGAQLIQQYGIDAQALFQVLSGQAPQYQPQAQPQLQPQDMERTVEAVLAKKEVANEYQRFVTEAPEKYPHFEQVKETMAGLLQAGLAQDYKSAYEAALRHPRHAEIFDAMQQQQREKADEAARVAAAAAVHSARSRTVSVKSATPSGEKTQQTGNKSLRDVLSESFDAVSSGRV